MADDRLFEAARGGFEGRSRERAEARAAGAAGRQRDEDAAPSSASSASSAPPSSHRRLIGWLGGDVGCALCARRALSGTAAVMDLARASRQLLEASWVVVMVGER
jgi:hypothetical protein